MMMMIQSHRDSVQSKNIYLHHGEPPAWWVSPTFANYKGKQLFFPLGVVVLEDLILETRDPEVQDPETWDLVTRDLEAVLAKEEVNAP